MNSGRITYVNALFRAAAVRDVRCREHLQRPYASVNYRGIVPLPTIHLKYG